MAVYTASLRPKKPPLDGSSLPHTGPGLISGKPIIHASSVLVSVLLLMSHTVDKMIMVITANVGHMNNREENIQPMNAMIKNIQNNFAKIQIFTGRIKFVVGLLISRQDYVGEYQQDLRNLSF